MPVAGYTAMGGGARSRRWRQIIADVTSRWRAREQRRGSGAGAGILAAAGAGIFSDTGVAAALCPLRPGVIEPDPARRGLYDRLYGQVYCELFPALRPYIDRLTALLPSGI